MRVLDLLKKWGLTGLKLETKFLEAEFSFDDHEAEAAWEMYVEMVTRIVTQPLDPSHGDEKTALTSVYSLFGTTREILKARGRKAQGFTKIAVVVLNQVVRPFTARWHRLSLAGAFDDPAQCKIFRAELEELQGRLRCYSALLADVAGVEDITGLAEESGDPVSAALA